MAGPEPVDPNDIYGIFAFLFGLSGAIALAALVSTGGTSESLGLRAAVGLGLCWPVLAILNGQGRKRPHNAGLKRAIFWASSVTASVSSLALMSAISWVLESGPTLGPKLEDVATRSHDLRAVLIVYLFPVVTCLVTGSSLYVAFLDAKEQRKELRRGRA